MFALAARRFSTASCRVVIPRVATHPLRTRGFFSGKDKPSEADTPTEDPEEVVFEPETEEEPLTEEQLRVKYSEVRAALQTSQATVEDTKKKLVYALAEIENVRKISRKDVANAREFALKGFGKDLLEVGDNMERALAIFPESAKEKADPLYSILQGIEMTNTVFEKVTAKHGISKMQVVPNETLFDPNFHDAIFQQPTDAVPVDTVISVVKCGYMIHGRVLRAASVGVSCAKNEE
eukprot:NODE_4143_length_835_cov_34.895480_g3985_i0.p1 GENE.NODE_4143_length_835_cov_34.895480_g3985_i0~~NODE_4143_length_835_cov_34.895480_g3985_i0.p1  ORF type:complete len:256 (+),score=86.99 NODE_4143_length_835_cov_34.895480_g3985_i0:63-770(+)